MKALPYILLTLLGSFAVVSAADAAAPKAIVARAAQPAAPSPFHKEFFASLADVEDKLVRLAEATPADKFGWRPASDVRSISEVYMHIAGANYVLSTFVGIDAPPTGQDFEKSMTKKAEVVAELKRSLAHLRTSAAAVTDPDKPVRMFGSQTTHRGVLTTALNHLHEHLGQSVAYARMNGVRPPWSR